MPAAPRRHEIDHRTMKLIVGVIALSLGNLTSFLAGKPLGSISAAYWETGWSQTIFIGFLFAIAAFLLAYNGYSRLEMVLSKVGAFAALGVAMFPCACGDHEQVLPYVHGASAAAMFLILAFFCHLFRQRALEKRYAEARLRARIYLVCGIAILLAIATLAFDHFSGRVLSARIPRLAFHGERTGLVAFGISWLVASLAIPGLARREERLFAGRGRGPAWPEQA